MGDKKGVLALPAMWLVFSLSFSSPVVATPDLSHAGTDESPPSDTAPVPAEVTVPSVSKDPAIGAALDRLLAPVTEALRTLLQKKTASDRKKFLLVLFSRPTDPEEAAKETTNNVLDRLEKSGMLTKQERRGLGTLVKKVLGDNPNTADRLRLAALPLDPGGKLRTEAEQSPEAKALAAFENEFGKRIDELLKAEKKKATKAKEPGNKKAGDKKAESPRPEDQKKESPGPEKKDKRTAQSPPSTESKAPESARAPAPSAGGQTVHAPEAISPRAESAPQDQSPVKTPPVTIPTASTSPNTPSSASSGAGSTSNVTSSGSQPASRLGANLSGGGGAAPASLGSLGGQSPQVSATSARGRNGLAARTAKSSGAAFATAGMAVSSPSGGAYSPGRAPGQRYPQMRGGLPVGRAYSMKSGSSGTPSVFAAVGRMPPPRFPRRPFDFNRSSPSDYGSPTGDLSVGDVNDGSSSGASRPSKLAATLGTLWRSFQLGDPASHGIFSRFHRRVEATRAGTSAAENLCTGALRSELLVCERFRKF